MNPYLQNILHDITVRLSKLEEQNMTPNTIEFRSTGDNTWVMRITADRRIEVNEDVEVDEAAKLVLASMQGLLTPQRTWVGLTDEDIAVVLTGDASLGTRLDELTPSWIELVKAVEAKLKEKNT